MKTKNPLKQFRPLTAGTRQMSVVDFSVLTSRRPKKKLTKSFKRSFGRDALGHISVRHKGGGAKRKFRQIFSLDRKLGMPAKVEQLEYDPNRSAFIALVCFKDKTHAYLLAWEGVKVGDEVTSGERTEIQKGNRLCLKNIPNGVAIYNIEMQPGQGGKLVRSAGDTTSIVAKEGKFVHLKMPSGEIRRINRECFASIGQVSNPTHGSQRIGKAGRTRHMGIRPTVRGKAMHPAAHPHGGGEGVNGIGLKYPKTPWGKHARGVLTRKKKKYSDKMIIKRRKK